MSNIKLVHSGGNSVSLTTPDSNPAANRTFKLPSDADGTLARTIDVAFKSYAIIADQKANDVDGGTFTTGDLRTRDLNTELIDPDGIVSISSNQFTLQAGTYFIKAHAPAYRVNRHMAKLYRTSGTPADIAFGTGGYTNSTYLGHTDSIVRARVTISSATTYEIRHRCSATHNTSGFGQGANFGTTELYTVVEIFKEA